VGQVKESTKPSAVSGEATDPHGEEKSHNLAGRDQNLVAHHTKSTPGPARGVLAPTAALGWADLTQSTDVVWFIDQTRGNITSLPGSDSNKSDILASHSGLMGPSSLTCSRRLSYP
jgi:hypothetical protein